MLWEACEQTWSWEGVAAGIIHDRKRAPEIDATADWRERKDSHKRSSCSK